jgi:hypothetical protein
MKGETMRKTDTDTPPAKPERVMAKQDAERIHPRVGLEKNDRGNLTICAGTKEDLKAYSNSLVKAFGALDEESARFIHGGLVGAVTQDWHNPTETELNEPLVLAASIDAQDPIEGMLAAQMAATHMHAMKMLGKINCSKTDDGVAAASNAANKLLRTFAMQVEALKKHRAKASQTIRVERFYVTEGGQAVVGDIFRLGGGNQKIEDQAHEPRPRLVHEQRAPMFSENSERDFLPMSRNKG